MKVDTGLMELKEWLQDMLKNILVKKSNESYG